MALDKFIIRGGKPLKGEVQISGSKNSALPILAACLLTREECVLHNVPDLSDIRFMGEIMQFLGSSFEFKNSIIRVKTPKLGDVAPYDLVRKMRGSICVMGPMLGRLKKAKVSLPGGCVIGARPIDLHLKGFKALGAKLKVEGGYVIANAKDLAGTEVFLGGSNGSTVLGTANLMMAATLAKGTTVIESAACEPEVVDLANFLIKMGARIIGAGSPTVTVVGVDELHGAEHTVIPDRIETATFMVAAAATNGDVLIKGGRPEHLHAVWDKMIEAGVSLEKKGTDIHVRGSGKLQAVDIITLPYSGFPTDVQAQMMVLMSVTPGISIITEKIFPDRFMHVNELSRMGAEIRLEGSSAIVKGVPRLSGAPVMASDLRASAALVIAGLVARGESEVNRVYHIDRGYEKIDEKLMKLGAKMTRAEEK